MDPYEMDAKWIRNPDLRNKVIPSSGQQCCALRMIFWDSQIIPDPDSINRETKNSNILFVFSLQVFIHT